MYPLKRLRWTGNVWTEVTRPSLRAWFCLLRMVLIFNSPSPLCVLIYSSLNKRRTRPQHYLEQACITKHQDWTSSFCAHVLFQIFHKMTFTLKMSVCASLKTNLVRSDEFLQQNDVLSSAHQDPGEQQKQMRKMISRQDKVSTYSLVQCKWRFPFNQFRAFFSFSLGFWALQTFVEISTVWKLLRGDMKFDWFHKFCRPDLPRSKTLLPVFFQIFPVKFFGENTPFY